MRALSLSVNCRIKVTTTKPKRKEKIIHLLIASSMSLFWTIQGASKHEKR